MSSFGDKAKQVIGTVAPMLGTVLGGPLGGLAGAALAKALGTSDPKAQEAEIVSGDPQVLMKLKEAENELQEHMRQLDIDEEKLRFDDTANARAREIAVKDNTPKILSYLTTAGFFGALAASMAFEIPAASKAIVFTMIGSLGTVWINQQGYYFGSSAGSAAKTDALNKIAVSK